MISTYWLHFNKPIARKVAHSKPEFNGAPAGCETISEVCRAPPHRHNLPETSAPDPQAGAILLGWFSLMAPQLGLLMHPARRVPSGVHLLLVSIAEPVDASQWPKSIAPIVNRAAPIQIKMAALFSEMVGVGFMAR
jgi:hypothetical protein